MDVMFWIWLAVIIGTIVIEALTMELVSIWFTIGAVIPFILSSVNAVSYQWQIIIFIIISAVLLLTLRRTAKKYLLKNSNEKTNTDTFIGKKYKLCEAITQDKVGALKINGVVWSAISQNDENIESGSYVEVLKIEGNKLIVRKINN